MRRDLPPYVKAVKRGRRVYYYYQRHGKLTRLPDIADPDFYASYARLGRGLPSAPAKRNWKVLVDAYMAHDRYKRLSPRTKRDYQKAIDFLRGNWGDLDPARLKRSQVLMVMNANAYRKANDFKTVVSQCLEVAKDMDWLTHNVAKDITPARPQTKLNRQPWPQDLIEAFREEAAYGTRERTVFELALGTGQRIGDVLRMRWPDISGRSIAVKQSKTGAELYIPFTPALANCLAQTPREGIYIADARGKRAEYFSVARGIRKIREKIGAEAYDIHALRHSAARELYEAGCTDEEVKAITGHSAVQMLRLYGGAARQRRHAESAQKKRT